jgi:integrase
MASLTRDSRGRSPFWICCYTSADGRQLKVTTKKTDRKQAWEFCLAIERAEELGRDRLLTEQHAKKIIGEILERTTGTSIRNDTVEQWFTHWLEMKQTVRADHTMLRYRQVLRDFRRSLGHKAKLPLAHVTSKDVLKYRDSITAAGKTARTANLALAVVSNVLNSAKRQHLIDTNPATALENLTIKSEEKGTFTPDQVSKLIKAAGGDWRLAILTGYFLGARLSDVANLHWDSIDWTEKIIHFTAGKTRKPITIPLHPQLEREFRRKPGIGKALIFPSLAGKQTGGAQGLSRQFTAIMKKAGIDGTRTRTSGRRAVSRLSFHSLRHSFNSELANRGVSQEIRQKLTGHSSAAINRVYTHHELEPLRTAIAVIPAVK